jgi:dimethylaniline monooxygenase (N-oxide forming)
MKICVVGAGPSGLTTIKQLLDEGHEVTCFEQDDDIGGIWYRHTDDDDETKAFDNLVLTISMKLMAFSDFRHEGARTFTNHAGYLKYLRAYTDKFELRGHIRFNTTVTNLRCDDGVWTVGVDTPDGAREHTFDAVALCIGPFRTPNKEIPELAGFSGPVHHSANYRNAERLRGKRVLIVGIAESGADIVREVSDVAAACTLSIRSYTFLLPRLFFGKYSTDDLTFRAHHYEAWVRAAEVDYPKRAIWGDSWAARAVFFVFAFLYGFITVMMALLGKLFRRRPKITAETLNNLGQPMLPLKMDLSVENTQEHVDAINDWNHKSHLGEGNWSMRKIFCKNLTFIPNLVQGKFDLNDSGIEGAEGKVVRFKDSTVQEFDEVVLCTGYKKNGSFFGGVEVEDNNVRNLYKLAFHPDYDGRLAVIGNIRPYSGGVPVCAEMQARYFALICSGKAKLPADVKERIAREKAWYEAWTSLSPDQEEAIPSQVLFMDSIAREIGCLTPMSKLIFRPRLFIKHWFCSFNQACYRMVGPHSDPVAARRELLGERLPAENPLLTYVMTVLLLMPRSVHPKNVDLVR